jgi:hypothetical protein
MSNTEVVLARISPNGHNLQLSMITDQDGDVWFYVQYPDGDSNEFEEYADAYDCYARNAEGLRKTPNWKAQEAYDDIWYR